MGGEGKQSNDFLTGAAEMLSSTRAAASACPTESESVI